MIFNLTVDRLKKFGLDNEQINEVRLVNAIKGTLYAIEKIRVFVRLNKIR